jgi:hypothetical protein
MASVVSCPCLSALWLEEKPDSSDGLDLLAGGSATEQEAVEVLIPSQRRISFGWRSSQRRTPRQVW